MNTIVCRIADFNCLAKKIDKPNQTILGAHCSKRIKIGKRYLLNKSLWICHSVKFFSYRDGNGKKGSLLLDIFQLNTIYKKPIK